MARLPDYHLCACRFQSMLDYSALAKLTERQQLQYLLSMTSSSAERAPLADLKPNVDLQMTVSKPAKAVITTVQVCADDHDLGGDIEVSLALVDPLLPSVEERHALKGFKSIADELLPYMRHGSLVRTATSAVPQLTNPASWADALGPCHCFLLHMRRGSLYNQCT